MTFEEVKYIYNLFKEASETYDESFDKTDVREFFKFLETEIEEYKKIGWTRYQEGIYDLDDLFAEYLEFVGLVWEDDWQKDFPDMYSRSWELMRKQAQEDEEYLESSYRKSVL